MNARGAGFAGGTGEPNDPYRIATAAQLLSIDSDPNLRAKHYILTASIDLKGKTLSKPVISSFGGVFDGGGHAIRNLKIRPLDEAPDYVGLFGMIDKKGRIYNVDVLDADVEGRSGPDAHVGILAGSSAGKIHGCSVTGIIRGGQGDGLVGSNTGPLSGCHADVVRE